MATLKLEIVTPEGVAASEDVDMVTLPGVEGEMGIYPQHVPLVTELVRLHDGSLKLESARGKGTTAILRFPKERIIAG